jgi:hypothetical protein
MKDKQGQVCLLLPNAWDAAKRPAVDIFRDCKEFAMKLVLLDRIRWENIEQRRTAPAEITHGLCGTSGRAQGLKISLRIGGLKLDA